MSSPWPIVTVLALAQAVLGTIGWSHAHAPVTYVFTPLVNVAPGTLSGEEAEALDIDLKNQIDARDVQQAYARMGSTMSLLDFLGGVESLQDLTPAQRTRLAKVLEDAKADHTAVIAVQREILDLEADIGRQVEALR